MAIGRAHLFAARGSRDQALQQLDLAERVIPEAARARGPMATQVANVRKEIG